MRDRRMETEAAARGQVEAAAREDQAATWVEAESACRDREAVVAIAAGSRDVRPESPAVATTVAGSPDKAARKA